MEINKKIKFIRGDANRDGKVDLSDAIFILNYLFKNGKSSFCADTADVNDDGTLDISDAVRVLVVLFKGQEMSQPFPERGTDPTEDELSCLN